MTAPKKITAKVKSKPSGVDGGKMSIPFLFSLSGLKRKQQCGDYSAATAEIQDSVQDFQKF